MSNARNASHDVTLAELEDLARSGLPVRSHSGQVRSGDIFVLLPGSGSDGSDYLAEALERGAGYVIVPAACACDTGAVTCLRHDNPRQALGALAAASFATDALPFPLIGVTGTNGKTTVSYLIEHLFAANGKRVGVVGTVSYRWPGHQELATLTTPGCWQLHGLLARMRDSGVDAAVMEVSSHALDQLRVAGLRFQVGVWTNLTQDHLDYHGDMDTYFHAKAKLFREQDARDKSAVLNWDDPYGRRLIDETPNILAYGLGPKPAALAPTAALQGRILEKSIDGLRLRMEWGTRSWEFASPLVGGHNALNLLAAQAAGLCSGLTPEHLSVLEQFQGVPGRLERIANRQGLYIFVDYAHTPDALENVLRALREQPLGRLITVFGCGGNRDRTKRPLMGQAVSRYSDIAVLTSDNPRHEEPLAIMDEIRPGLKQCPMVLETPDRRKAIGLALDEMRAGDVLLVAGKGHESYQQIGDTKFPFSDQAVIREYLG